MKQLFTCFLLCISSINLVDAAPKTQPQGPEVVFSELIKSIDNLNKMVKVGVQKRHSPKNIPDHCLLSAFRCFVNESLFLQPEFHQKENLFHTLSRIQASQPNVQRILPVSAQNCRSCINYPRQPEDIFVREFKSLLQRLYQTSI